MAGFIQSHPPEAVHNAAPLIQQVDVGGSAHQLRHQNPTHLVAHFVGTQEGQPHQPLHGGLLHGQKPSPGQVLAQQHTEHGGLIRVFRVGGGEMEPGGRGIGGNQQPLPSPGAAQQQDDGVPGGLVNFLHSGVQDGVLQLLHHAGQKERVKCHKIPP